MSRIIAIDARLIGAKSTGDSTYWTCLVEELAKSAQDLRFLLFSDRPCPDEFKPGLNMEWIVLRAPDRRSWSYVRFPIEARRRGASATHTQYSMSPLARNGITTVHDVSFLIEPQWFQPRDRLLLKLGVGAAVRRAKAIITVSQTSRGEIEQLLPASRGKVSVTPNACPPWIQRVPADVAQARVAARFGLTGPFALTVSTRWPRKNMELAVAAVDRLPQEVDLNLALTDKAGWGDQTPGRRGRALGYVTESELCDLYSAARVYLCPSLHEGFGLPLLEAFRCGCPVICGPGGALPEVGGDAALIQKTYDPAAWSQALAAVLHDSGKLDSLRERGLKRVDEYSWAHTANLTLDVYRGAME